MAARGSFLETLQEIRRGEIVGDLTADLMDLVAAVKATGKRGEIHLVLKVKPASLGDIGTLVITDEIKVKLPKMEKGSTILYATDENLLQRKDPRQPELAGLKSPATVTQIDREAAAQ